MNKEIMELLKEISKIVCIDLCGKICELDECRECNFMITLNRLMNKILGEDES